MIADACHRERAWLWSGSELRGYREFWKSSEFVAQCETCSEIPGQNNPCGIYSVTERRHLRTLSLPVAHPSFVYGKVELSGLVIEHERGYRAERARMTELSSGPRLLPSLLSATRTYPSRRCRECDTSAKRQRQ